jgi:kinesin family member C2/C3
MIITKGQVKLWSHNS